MGGACSLGGKVQLLLFICQGLNTDGTLFTHGGDHGHLETTHKAQQQSRTVPCSHFLLPAGAHTHQKHFSVMTLTMKSSPDSNLLSISLPVSLSGTRRSSLISPLSAISVMYCSLMFTNCSGQRGVTIHQGKHEKDKISLTRAVRTLDSGDVSCCVTT